MGAAPRSRAGPRPRRARSRGGKLEIGRIDGLRLGEAKAGQRFDGSLENRSFRHVEPPGSPAVVGAPPFVGVASYPPDSRGTYEVLEGYRIRLSYADGTEKVHPFGIGLEDG